jgi:hypothetical protein
MLLKSSPLGVLLPRLFVLCLVFHAAAFASPSEALRPFKTNGCTGFWNGPPSRPEQWRHCCVVHDLYFWAGGAKRYRKSADQKLRDCIQATGHEGTAWLMYWGVRIGSLSPLKIKGEQWGNGWLDGRERFSPLRPDDLDTIKKMLVDRPNPELSAEALSGFYRDLERQIQESLERSDSRIR